MLQPIEDRILVQVAEIEETTASGLYIPESAKDKPSDGIVIRTGPGLYYKGEYLPIGINVGDHVIFNKFAGMELKDGGETYLLLTPRDVLAIRVAE